MYLLQTRTILQMLYELNQITSMYIVVSIIFILIIVCFMKNKTIKQEGKVVNKEQNQDNKLKQSIAINKRHERLLRHKRVWAVLRFMKVYEELYSSNSFYDLDKAIINLNQSLLRLDEDEFTPAIEDISIAIRFCRYQYSINNCTYSLSQKEIATVYEWRSFKYDKNEVLIQTGKRFKCYWDEVIANYKRQSDKNRRKEYLVRHLNEMKDKDTFKHVSISKDIFENLIRHYS